MARGTKHLRVQRGHVAPANVCSPLPEKEKRILATWIFGEAWDRFTTAQYAHMRLSAFLTTGCGLTLTGKNDHLVTVQGAPSEGLDAASTEIAGQLGGSQDVVAYLGGTGLQKLV